MCSPNDHVVAVDDASQGSAFQGEAVADDNAGSATETHTFRKDKGRNGVVHQKKVFSSAIKKKKKLSEWEPVSCVALGHYFLFCWHSSWNIS